VQQRGGFAAADAARQRDRRVEPARRHLGRDAGRLTDRRDDGAPEHQGDAEGGQHRGGDGDGARARGRGHQGFDLLAEGESVCRGGLDDGVEGAAQRLQLRQGVGGVGQAGHALAQLRGRPAPFGRHGALRRDVEVVQDVRDGQGHGRGHWGLAARGCQQPFAFGARRRGGPRRRLAAQDGELGFRGAHVVHGHEGLVVHPHRQRAELPLRAQRQQADA
jgi:hypothetical protein